MQFDSFAQYFDTQHRHGLLEVLDGVNVLDDIALVADMTQHVCGLRMLAARPENLVRPVGENAARLGTLLDKMAHHYDHIVVDVPRRLDPYALPALERADRVMLVVQQTLSHLRDAARMLQIFAEHRIGRDKVLVVVNRFEKNAPVDLEDVKRALHGCETVAVPSDFKTVAESINLGTPIYEHARNCSVTKALVALQTKLGGVAGKSSTGLLGKALSNLLRKESWSPT
jgi:pilus assembly protein CpaE